MTCSPRRRFALALAFALLLAGCGGDGNTGSGGDTSPAPPSAPTGLAATAGNQQVTLSWAACAGASGYHIKRAGTHGGPYTQVGAPTGTTYTDTGLTNGTTYYYVATAFNSTGESSNSAEVSATPVSPSPTVTITVDVLQDRHPISPLVYGVNFPPDTTYIADSGATLVRWGGNASSRYNWKNFNTNAANDWYFLNRPFGNAPLYQDSTQFVSKVAAAGGYPIMTMSMLPWVAKDATSYSFSVAKYGAQCKVSPYNSDQGNGVKTDCQTNITGIDLHDAHTPLLDQPGAGDPPNSVYRNQWAAALSGSFGTAPHFYDMDNEMDIWGGTHRDVHPNPATYDELRDIFVSESRALKTWDTNAIRFGPVSCCWWFYWNAAAGGDRAIHGGIDFIPWWINEVAWSDQLAGNRSLDVFDFHAYPDSPDTSSYTLAQKQALALRILRDWWDPTYTSESGSINQDWATQTQPLKRIPFRIPRLRAIVNNIYPNTPVAITEWNAAFAGESDFSTALADADAFGILGRERVYAAARWTAADPGTPAYQALKLFRNYDGQRHGFGTLSVSAVHTADPGLLSTYAALDSSGSKLTLLVINKDPKANAQAQISLNNFHPTQVTSYTLASSSPASIVAGPTQPWPGSWKFGPYSATLLAISGSLPQNPSAEWQINPDAIMAPASGTAVLQPRIIAGAGTITLTGIRSDMGISASITQPTVTSSQPGSVTLAAGATPGFYHYTVTAADNLGVMQTQGGWMVVGNPAATLIKSGDGQSALHGTDLTIAVTVSPGQSGGALQGASIFFTTDAGILSSRIVQTDGSGKASVRLTLPAAPGTVHVTAEGPVPLGHPTATFTLTSQ